MPLREGWKVPLIKLSSCTFSLAACCCSTGLPCRMPFPRVKALCEIFKRSVIPQTTCPHAWLRSTLEYHCTVLQVTCGSQPSSETAMHRAGLRSCVRCIFSMQTSPSVFSLSWTTMLPVVIKEATLKDVPTLAWLRSVAYVSKSAAHLPANSCFCKSSLSLLFASSIHPVKSTGRP
jgi:hypothetical protein